MENTHTHVLLCALGVGLTSCIIQPANDDEITSRATPVGFVGFAQQNGEQIRLEARRPPDGAFVQFATATADGAFQYTQYGETLYSWNTTVAVPTARWEPGAVGYRTHVRGMRFTDTPLYTFDTNFVQTQSCVEGAGNWGAVQNNCVSSESPVLTVTTNNYVPDVTRGRTDCSYASDNACSPCIADFFNTILYPNVNIQSPNSGFRVGSGSMLGTGITTHNQGIARLRDLVISAGPGSTQNRVGRVVMSDNSSDQGLHYYEQPVQTGTCGVYDTVFYTNYSPVKRYRQNIRRQFGHPGGMQAHGDYIVMAMEDYDKGTDFNTGREINMPSLTADYGDGGVVFLRYPPTPDATGYAVSAFVLDGSRGEPDQSENARASAAAFVQLYDYHFLLAVAGSDHIWFYVSDRPSIDLETQWRYISQWTPSNTTHPAEFDCETDEDGTQLSTCYGAGQIGKKYGPSGLALLTDCSESIHLVLMHGSNGTPGADYQWIQTFRIEQHTTGAVQLIPESWQRDYVGISSTNNPGFRWAGGSYISELQTPVLMNTERGFNEGSNQHVDGHLYYPSLGCGFGRLAGSPLEVLPPLHDPDDDLPPDTDSYGVHR